MSPDLIRLGPNSRPLLQNGSHELRRGVIEDSNEMVIEFVPALVLSQQLHLHQTDHHILYVFPRRTNSVVIELEILLVESSVAAVKQAPLPSSSHSISGEICVLRKKESSTPINS